MRLCLRRGGLGVRLGVRVGARARARARARVGGVGRVPDDELLYGGRVAVLVGQRDGPLRHRLAARVIVLP